MATDPAAPADTSAVHTPAFDRAAIAILGTMLTLIVMLTALLVTVSAPDTTDPTPTAQTTAPAHHA